MSKAVKLFVLLVCLLLSGAAYAAPPNCTIAATDIAFDSYNTSSSTAQIGTINITCNRPYTGLPVTITPDTGRNMSSSGNTLAYNVYTNASHTIVWGDGSNGTVTPTVDVTTACGPDYCATLTVYGLIPAGQVVPTGSYSGTPLTATVSYQGNRQALTTFSASATVTGSCTISAVSTMNFGSLGLSFMTTDKTGVSANIDYTCSAGMGVILTLGQGSNPAAGSSDAAPLRQMSLGATSNYIKYNLYTDNTYSTVWGNTAATGVQTTGTGSGQTALVYGTALHATVPAGNYSDIVVVTITF
ncbi:MAG: spore coat protein U domain-containing protein [Acidobacteriia bacterium]|nr:spore coat protein U domain-containing protein [Terriglobia bacterium]